MKKTTTKTTKRIEVLTVTAKNNAVIKTKEVTAKYATTCENVISFDFMNEHKELKKASVSIYENNGNPKALFISGAFKDITTIMVVNDCRIVKVFTTVNMSTSDKLFKTKRELLKNICKDVNEKMNEQVKKLERDYHNYINLFTDKKTINELKGVKLGLYTLANANKITVK